MTRFSVARFDLALSAVDPTAALRELLALLGGRTGFVLDKRTAEEDAAFVGAAPFEALRVRAGRVWRSRCGRARASRVPGSPFEALGRRLRAFAAEGGEPFSCGAVGWLGYDMIRHLERVPLDCAGEEGALMLYDRVLRWDRRRGRVEWLALLRRGASGRAAAAQAAKLAERLKRRPPAQEPPAARSAAPLSGGALGRAGFMAGVRRLKEHIRAGDIFQAVLSERFSAPAGAPEDVFRALARHSPAPYLFWLRDDRRHVIGASPERLVRVVGGRALNCPIAGTRPRGRTPREDRRLERALVRSPKERAEHLMLVDLARNDLGRVCAPGTVRVAELMKVRRFPNVMHLVSEVEGRLERGRDAWEALQASFPAGTVSGAPKVRAMELLAGLERVPRGFYAGAVVQHDFSGNLDSCIAIRTLELGPAGRATLQAGAGIVADSRPEAEYREVRDKLLALRWALAASRNNGRHRR